MRPSARRGSSGTGSSSTTRRLSSTWPAGLVRVPGAVELEDMISWGVLRLLVAIEAYGAERSGNRANFESCAIFKIRWPSSTRFAARVEYPATFACAPHR